MESIDLDLDLRFAPDHPLYIDLCGESGEAMVTLRPGGEVILHKPMSGPDLLRLLLDSYRRAAGWA